LKSILILQMVSTKHESHSGNAVELFILATADIENESALRFSGSSNLRRG